MNIFGQVWLWSLLSFVAGVLLTWLVMVRPARKQIADLDDQLLDARRSAKPVPAAVTVDDFEVDEWEAAPPRSLSDEVLTPPAPVPALPPAPTPAPYAEPPAYFGEPVPAPAPVSPPPPPVVEEEEPAAHETTTFDAQPELDEEPAAPVRQYLEPEEAQRRFEEQLAEQKALADAEDDRPRSLFERLAPEAPPETPAEQTTVLSQSGLEAADFDDEPELPAEQTSLLPTVPPVAEPATPAAPPTAGPEVEQPDDFIYQPREVWAQEEQEVFLDEAAEQEDEPVRTRSEQTSFIAVEESSWPDSDLTGEYPAVRDEISGQLDGFTEPEAEVEPETAAEQTGLIEPITDLDAPHVRNGVFETTSAEEPQFAEPELEAEPEVEPEPAHSLREEPAYEEPVYEEFVAPEHTGSFTMPFTTPGAPPPAPFSAFEPRVEADEVPERTPRAVGAAFSHGVETPAAAPAAPAPERSRSLFEPLLDADEPLPALGQTRTLPDTSNDQPFVPKFVPSDEPLLAAPPEPDPEPVELPQRHTEAGLPIREARRSTMQQRQQSFPAFSAFESAKPEAPAAPALPVRPRPVGFSPSTGGAPSNAGSGGGSPARFQQPEGFNPRSPFGPGSVLPKSDGHAPAADFAVKATLTGRRYYSQGSSNFTDTRADVWFRTEADAEKAGFRPAP
ncbi:hypothetical protein [Lentzea sp. NBRC 102530]|uniref:sunset domain-containing protein n=1 Tax=Lentzea sp. NBRC 102530 TaxID=3032201 RepID=UPI0024A5CABE|nr:hypothetical protein [Lentzea sp. NBRC 102530]GLY53796.1 hypothetical protein Lesp01_74520 [Lentzea sp. NBRC 102530]